MKTLLFLVLVSASVMATSKPYVCYEKKIVSESTGKLAYVGCKRYNDSCKSNNKLHFGKYPSESKTSAALRRCKKSSPKFVDSGKEKVVKSKQKSHVKNAKKSYSKPKKRHFSTGNYVCSTWSSGANGWCGYITQSMGSSVRVENYKVKCGRGGFLGICTNISGGSCTGNTRLFVDETYKNPRSLIVPKSCLD